MHRLLSAIPLLLVGCAGASPRIVVGDPSERSGVVADVSSRVLAAVLPSGDVTGLSITRIGEGQVQLVAEDATTVRVCWGEAALALSDRAYLRVELLEGEARLTEHRVDFRADGWGTVTVPPEEVLVGLERLEHDSIPPRYHVHLTLHPDGRYDATLTTSRSSISSTSAPSVEGIPVAGGPIWIMASTRTD